MDHPYEGEKAALLDAVARANRCHTVWSPDLGFTTVFGFDADIDAVDLLYTSLLVQAHRAMAQTEPPGGKAGRARLKAYRQSFLVSFATRIGERLADAAEAALADATRTPDGPGPPTRPTCCRCSPPATNRSARPCTGSSRARCGPGAAGSTAARAGTPAGPPPTAPACTAGRPRPRYAPVAEVLCG